MRINFKGVFTATEHIDILKVLKQDDSKTYDVLKKDDIIYINEKALKTDYNELALYREYFKTNDKILKTPRTIPVSEEDYEHNHDYIMLHEKLQWIHYKIKEIRE